MTTKDYKQAAEKLKEFRLYLAEWTHENKLPISQDQQDIIVKQIIKQADAFFAWLCESSMKIEYNPRPSTFKPGGIISASDNQPYTLQSNSHSSGTAYDIRIPFTERENADKGWNHWEYPGLPPFKVRHIPTSKLNN